MTTLTGTGLLFDLDGTLVNSTKNVEQMWRAWCERAGVDADELLAISEGRQGKSVVAELAPHLDPVAEDDWIIDYQLKQTGPVERIAGVGPMLTGLSSEGRWGIVTSCVRDLAHKRLDSAELIRPPMLVPADDVRESKPSPEGFLLGAERLGLPPGECIVFEDSDAGLAAAEAAGMKAVAITAATRDTPSAAHSAVDWTEIAIDWDGQRWSVRL